MNSKARFVHPSEFGLEFPINTQAELYQIGKAINASLSRMNPNEQYRTNYDKIFRKAQEEVAGKQQ